MPRLDGEPEDLEGGAVEFKALIEVYPEIGEINIARHATNLERTPHQMRNATPEQGEHTDAILADLGYTADQIADLHAKRVV